MKKQLVVPQSLVGKFKELSMQNTITRKETGGLLFAELVNQEYIVNVLLIPKQEGVSDKWMTVDETEVGVFSEQNPNLHMMGTIHTHPGFDARPSSVDLHQHFKIQKDQQSSIAIIVAPERNQSPFYTITPFGMTELANCTADPTLNNGFHPHRSVKRLYAFATNVRINDMYLNVVDQRYDNVN